MDLTLRDADGELLGASAEPARTTRKRRPSGWVHQRDAIGVYVRLDGGRTLTVMVPDRDEPRNRVLFGLLAIGGLAAIGSWPVARRITRRLESLRAGVERFGGGDLGARAPVEGTDEVADLAKRFNASADRLQALILVERRMTASASHELRSPLTRLRMAVELLDDGSETRQPLIEGAIRDIEELDVLVGDLLLSGRVETGATNRDVVDLGGLLREEGARVDAVVTGDGRVRGDAPALRRLIRNLLDNAKRYGGGTIEASLTQNGSQLRLSIADRGPGVAETHRERIFDAFYRPDGHDEGRDGGVGLGLYLVRRIAQTHGGDVRVEPRPGGGSIFWVDLPAEG